MKKEDAFLYKGELIENQRQLFSYVWDTRPHVSEISGKPLHHPGHLLYTWQFGHILSKQAYPSYRLNPENIMLMLPEEHGNQESFEKFQQRKQELKEQYYKEKKYGK